MNKISLYASALLVSTNLMAAGPVINLNSTTTGDTGTNTSEFYFDSGSSSTYSNTQVFIYDSTTTDLIVDATTSVHVTSAVGIDGVIQTLLAPNRPGSLDLTNNYILRNLGSLQMTNDENANTLYFDEVTSGSGLINGSSTNSTASIIANTTDSNYSANAINMGGSFGGTVENYGLVKATIQNELNENAYSIGQYYTNNNVIVNNNSTGRLEGNLNLGGTLNNYGTVTLPKMGSNNSAWVDIYNQSSSGILQIQVDSNSAGNVTDYSKLQGENITFDSGSTIDVNVLNQNLLAGQTLSGVVEASGTSASLTASGLNITDNSALLNFTYSLSNGGLSLDLQTVSDGTIHSSVVSGGGNSAAQNAGRALTTIQNSGNTQMNSVFTALNNLSTNQAVSKKIEETTSQISNAASEATSQISRNTLNILNNRLIIAPSVGKGTNSGDMVFGEKSLWIKPFGSIGSQQDKDGLNGFDTKTYGLGLGIEGEYADNRKLGFALFYANSNVDMNNISQDADLDVFSASVYGNVPVIDDKTQLLYQVAYSLQKTDTRRDISLTNQTATADYTSKTASADLRLVRDYQLNNEVLLQPMVSTTYRHFNSPSYKESGADSLNLNVDKFSTDEFLVGLGTGAQYKIDNSSKLIGNVNLYYDLIDDDKSITSSYAGASGVSFDTDGIDNGRLSHELGFGYEKEITTNSNINFSYNYQGTGTDYSDHLVSAKYVLKF